MDNSSESCFPYFVPCFRMWTLRILRKKWLTQVMESTLSKLLTQHLQVHGAPEPERSTWPQVHAWVVSEGRNNTWCTQAFTQNPDTVRKKKWLNDLSIQDNCKKDFVVVVKRTVFWNCLKMFWTVTFYFQYGQLKTVYYFWNFWKLEKFKWIIEHLGHTPCLLYTHSYFNYFNFLSFWKKEIAKTCIFS